jgi:DNA polymerase-1
MKLIGFDIETSGAGEAYGLQPYRVKQGTARITSAALVTEDGEVLFAKLEPRMRELRDVFYSIKEEFPDAVFIGWSTQFDVAWLIAEGMEEVVNDMQWLDGEVLRRAIENDTSDMRYGLKPTVTKYLPNYTGYEEEVGGNFDVIDQKLLDYNILDSGLTAKLGRIFIDMVDDRSLVLSTIICQAIVPVAGAWVDGIEIDVEALNKWEHDIDQELVVHLAEVMRLGNIRADESVECKKMLTSPVKLKAYLTAKGYQVLKTDQTELSKYVHVPLIKAISDYKKASTAKTKFIGGIRKSLEYNGGTTTHPSCRLWNTYTGRFGYTSTTTKKKLQTGIAIHQFPRKPAARSCIVAPKGFLLAEMDFATQESRLLCDFSRDPVLLDIFTSGKDIHSSMAAVIAEWDYEKMIAEIANGNPEAKNFRQLAKVVNLSCAYRTGWKKLIDVGRTQYDVIFDEATAQRLHRTFRDVYKNVPIYWDSAIRSAKGEGYAITRGGRKVIIEDWSRGNSWASESTAINFPIQGTGADMKFLAIAKIKDPLRAGGGKYLLDMHDAAFSLIPDTSAGYDLALAVQKIMSNLPYEQYYKWAPIVKLPVDLKIGKSWGTLKEIK